MDGDHKKSDPWRLVDGDRVDSFRVLRPIGRGGMAQVYAARDEDLGRRVALKLIVSSAGAEALDEARTTAQFSHPNIVTLYAVGTYAGLPYLALEYLEGETLRERLRSGSMSVQEVLRMGRDVAEALREAHRHHIQHRDLHPRNIFLAADGRPRVLDFGLSALGPTAYPSGGRASLRGTPAYMAPEQWRGESLTPAVDIWALGLVLYEALTGAHPYASKDLSLASLRQRVLLEQALPPPSLSRGDVPSMVDTLVLACLSWTPGERPDATGVAAQLSSMLSLSFTPSGGEPSPFKGLMPFTEEDAARFYGREREVASFVERLRKTAFIAVIGASGAGKSSFVQAGVVPRTRESGPLTVVALRPGRTPLEALVAELFRHEPSDTTLSIDDSESSVSTSLGHDEPGLVGQLRQNPSLLGLRLQLLSERLDTRVLLFVDQLEEVVTLTEDAEDRRAFVEAISRASEDPSLLVRTVVTLREEFLSRVEASLGGLGWITQVAVLRNPEPEDLRRVLIEPVVRTQHTFDDEAVVDEMVSEASRSLACLPLLQFGGARLWEGRERAQKLLRRATYAEMGGLAGALAQHADRVLEALGPSEMAIGRTLCLRLVTPERTRRAVPRGALLEGLGERGVELLEQFVRARLVVSRSGGEGEEEELELVHESLIENWRRLAGWIAQSSDELILLGELERASASWERRGRRESDLWRGDALADAQRTLRDFPGEVPPRVRAFLAEGVSRERRAQWRARAALATLVFVLAGAAIGFARGQAEAERQRVRAEKVRAQVELEGARVAVERGQLVEARAKLRSSLETRDSVGGRWLWRRVLQESRRWSRAHNSYVVDARLDPFGRRLAVTANNSVLLYRATTGELDHILPAVSWPDRLHFSPDGRRIAVIPRGSRDVTVWPLADAGPELPSMVDLPAEPSLGWGQRGAWRTNDQLMLLMGARLFVWDVSRGVLARSERLEGGDGVAFAATPKGPEPNAGLYARSDSTRVLFGGRPPNPAAIDVRSSSVSALALHAPKGLVAIGLASGAIEVWRHGDGRRVWRADAHTQSVDEIAFDGDGDRLVSQAQDRALLWSIGRSQPVSTYDCPERVSGVALNRQGNRLAVSCKLGSVYYHALDVGSSDELVSGHRSETTSPVFSPDGQLLLTGSSDQSSRLWSVDSGRSAAEALHYPAGVWSTAYGPRGDVMAIGRQDGMIELIDPRSGQTVGTLPGHTAGVAALSFSPTGSEIMSGSFDGTIRRWSVSERNQLSRIEVGCRLQVVAVAKNGRVAGSCFNDPRTFVFEAEGQQALLLERTKGDNNFIAWTDEDELLMASDYGEVLIWTPEGGVETLVQDRYTYFIGFHGPSSTLVFEQEGAIELVPRYPEGARPVRMRGHRRFTNHVAFTSAGHRMASTGGDGAVRLWDVKTGRLIWRTQAFLADDALVFGHYGWRDLSEAPARSVEPSLPESLLTALEQPGAHSVGGKNSVCWWNDDGDLAWWPAHRADAEAVRWSSVLPREVVAVEAGCLVREENRVRRFRADGGVDVWGGEATVDAMAWTPEGVWVASDGRVRRWGGVWAEVVVDPDPRALARVGPWLALAYSSGRIELIDWGHGGKRQELLLEKPYLEEVARLAEGPDQTLVAGYVRGAVRVWDTTSGRLLLAESLNGPIAHLHVSEKLLMAVTELGAFGRWNLEPMRDSWCRLLDQIWGAVPFTWEAGLPVRQAPAETHPCRRNR